MDMLSRYLYAVHQALPQSEQRDDIIAEIAEALQSRIDEREAQLGRSLSADEEAAIIKAYGHPRVVAGRYEKVPYLIGPDFLPFYWYTLRLILTVVLAVILIGGALSAFAAGKMSVFIAALDAAWNAAIWICGAVTIGFALIERWSNKETALERLGAARWDPRRLPQPPRSDRHDPIPQGSVVIEFIVNVIAILALLDVPGFRYWLLYLLVLGPAAGAHVAAQFNYAAWTPAYVGTIAGAAMIAGTDVIAFFRPYMRIAYRWCRIAASTVTLIGVALTLTRTPLVLPADSPLNPIAAYVLYGAIAVLGLQIAVLLYKLVAPVRSQKVALL